MDGIRKVARKRRGKRERDVMMEEDESSMSSSSLDSISETNDDESQLIRTRVVQRGGKPYREKIHWVDRRIRRKHRGDGDYKRIGYSNIQPKSRKGKTVTTMDTTRGSTDHHIARSFSTNSENDYYSYGKGQEDEPSMMKASSRYRNQTERRGNKSRKNIDKRTEARSQKDWERKRPSNYRTESESDDGGDASIDNETYEKPSVNDERSFTLRDNNERPTSYSNSAIRKPDSGIRKKNHIVGRKSIRFATPTTTTATAGYNDINSVTNSSSGVQFVTPESISQPNTTTPRKVIRVLTDPWKTKGQLLEIARRYGGMAIQYRAKYFDGKKPIKDHGSTREMIKPGDLSVQVRFQCPSGSGGGSTYSFRNFRLPGGLKKGAQYKTIYKNTRPILVLGDSVSRSNQGDRSAPDFIIDDKLKPWDWALVKEFVQEAGVGTTPVEHFGHEKFMRQREGLEEERSLESMNEYVSNSNNGQHELRQQEMQKQVTNNALTKTFHVKHTHGMEANASELETSRKRKHSNIRAVTQLESSIENDAKGRKQWQQPSNQIDKKYERQQREQQPQMNRFTQPTCFTHEHVTGKHLTDGRILPVQSQQHELLNMPAVTDLSVSIEDETVESHQWHQPQDRSTGKAPGKQSSRPRREYGMKGDRQQTYAIGQKEVEYLQRRPELRISHQNLELQQQEGRYQRNYLGVVGAKCSEAKQQQQNGGESSSVRFSEQTVGTKNVNTEAVFYKDFSHRLKCDEVKSNGKKMKQSHVNLVQSEELSNLTTFNNDCFLDAANSISHTKNFSHPISYSKGMNSTSSKLDSVMSSRNYEAQETKTQPTLTSSCSYNKPEYTPSAHAQNITVNSDTLKQKEIQKGKESLFANRTNAKIDVLEFQSGIDDSALDTAARTLKTIYQAGNKDPPCAELSAPVPLESVNVVSPNKIVDNTGGGKVSTPANRPIHDKPKTARTRSARKKRATLHGHNGIGKWPKTSSAANQKHLLNNNVSFSVHDEYEVPQYFALIEGVGGGVEEKEFEDCLERPPHRGRIIEVPGVAMSGDWTAEVFGASDLKTSSSLPSSDVLSDQYQDLRRLRISMRHENAQSIGNLDYMYIHDENEPQVNVNEKNNFKTLIGGDTVKKQLCKDDITISVINPSYNREESFLSQGILDETELFLPTEANEKESKQNGRSGTGKKRTTNHMSLHVASLTIAAFDGFTSASDAIHRADPTSSQILESCNEYRDTVTTTSDWKQLIPVPRASSDEGNTTRNPQQNEKEKEVKPCISASIGGIVSESMKHTGFSFPCSISMEEDYWLLVAHESDNGQVVAVDVVFRREKKRKSRRRNSVSFFNSPHPLTEKILFEHQEQYEGSDESEDEKDILFNYFLAAPVNTTEQIGFGREASPPAERKINLYTSEKQLNHHLQKDSAQKHFTDIKFEAVRAQDISDGMKAPHIQLEFSDTKERSNTPVLSEKQNELVRSNNVDSKPQATDTDAIVVGKKETRKERENNIAPASTKHVMDSKAALLYNNSCHTDIKGEHVTFDAPEQGRDKVEPSSNKMSKLKENNVTTKTKDILSAKENSGTQNVCLTRSNSLQTLKPTAEAESEKIVADNPKVSEGTKTKKMEEKPAANNLAERCSSTTPYETSVDERKREVSSTKNTGISEKNSRVEEAENKPKIQPSKKCVIPSEIEALKAEEKVNVKGTGDVVKIFEDGKTAKEVMKTHTTKRLKRKAAIKARTRWQGKKKKDALGPIHKETDCDNTEILNIPEMTEDSTTEIAKTSSDNKSRDVTEVSILTEKPVFDPKATTVRSSIQSNANVKKVDGSQILAITTKKDETTSQRFEKKNDFNQERIDQAFSIGTNVISQKIHEKTTKLSPYMSTTEYLEKLGKNEFNNHGPEVREAPETEKQFFCQEMNQTMSRLVNASSSSQTGADFQKPSNLTVSSMHTRMSPTNDGAKRKSDKTDAEFVHRESNVPEINFDERSVPRAINYPMPNNPAIVGRNMDTESKRILKPNSLTIEQPLEIKNRVDPPVLFSSPNTCPSEQCFKSKEEDKTPIPVMCCDQNCSETESQFSTRLSLHDTYFGLVQTGGHASHQTNISSPYQMNPTLELFHEFFFGPDSDESDNSVYENNSKKVYYQETNGKRKAIGNITSKNRKVVARKKGPARTFTWRLVIFCLLSIYFRQASDPENIISCSRRHPSFPSKTALHPLHEPVNISEEESMWNKVPHPVVSKWRFQRIYDFLFVSDGVQSNQIT